LNLIKRKPCIFVLDYKFKNRPKEVVIIPEVPEYSISQKAGECGTFFLRTLQGFGQSFGVSGAEITDGVKMQVYIRRRLGEKMRRKSVRNKALTITFSLYAIPINLHADFRCCALVANDVQLPVGPLPLSRKTEQLEEKRS
jgi:hypothetical protein